MLICSGPTHPSALANRAKLSHLLLIKHHFPVITPLCFSAMVHCRAVQLIEFDSHAHLVSKAGSVISSKSPSPVSNAVQLIHRAVVHWQVRQFRVHNRIRFICDYETRYRVACQWTTALCINCRCVWKQVMAISANHGTGFTDEMRMRIDSIIAQP